ncbi:MAG: hypothetical protein JXQ84_09285 [Rhodospirillaceae bacterium]|nr:hypothetical protein [Rhodospirillaceae bacterium]
MTKTLILLRHLKSDWASPGLADPDRPLSTRGNRAGPLVRSAMATRCPSPELILCSSARRTRDTLSHVADIFPTAKTRFVDALYEASLATIRTLITHLPEHVTTALFIGHNPGLFDCAWFLAHPTEISQHAIFTKFPTGGVVAFTLPISAWVDAREGQGRLIAAFTPKDLMRND